VHVAALLTELALVVVVPFAAGVAVRSSVPARLVARAPRVATIAVSVLVWLVASTARLSSAYIGVVVALAVVIVVGAFLGSWIARFVDLTAGTSVVFAASMRDFAIAAGIVTAAFGARAAAPLGLYGIMVMLWGTGLVSALRRRRPAADRR
jgi:predicted Na+-dependent transporter